MATLEVLTELDAVNDMLLSIGQTPVNTLSVAGIRDVNLARSFLKSTSRRVQMVGFDFNTDRKYKITPDIDGFLKVPNGVLKIDCETPSSSLKRRRHPTAGWCIWNADDQTWVFTEAVEFKVVWGFVFDDLPDTARSYIAISAARKFQAQTIGSTSLDGYNAEDEQVAWISLLRDERGARDTNLFRANATIAGAASNRRY